MDSFEKIVVAFGKERGVEKARMFGSDGLEVGFKVFIMSVKGAFVAKLPRPASKS